MMDFNQILLFAGLGLLAIVLLFALWGFLGGFKRELKCIAVFIVLLVLSWLVYGDSATVLNAEAGQPIAELLNIRDNSITTVWDAILAYAKTIIPNGESLLVEGKETYNLLFNVASSICHAMGLIIGTMAVLIICPIIRLITHFVGLIIRQIKKSKVKEEVEETTINSTPNAKKQIVVPHSESGLDEAVITKDENEVVKKPAGKRRLWGAFAASLKGVFVVILICAPLSGLSSILNNVSPKTKELINDVVSGDAEFKVSQSESAVDVVFDFAKAYEESALGKFANASGFFFGKSFSESLNDNLLKLETKTQTIYLSDEINAFIDAANALNGKTDLTQLSKKEFSNVFDSLKNSKLIVELMPVAIEYAYSVEDINTLLKTSKQENAFLSLRYVNWRSDIDAVLDAIKEAYDLGLFPISEFNYLTMDVEELRDVFEYLGSTEFMEQALPVIVNVALSTDQINELVGNVKVSFNEYNLEKELNALVDIYAKLQKFEITDLNELDVDEFVNKVLNDEKWNDLAFEIIYDVLDLQLMDKLTVPLVFGYAKNNAKLKELLENANEYKNFANLEKETTISDVKVFVETAQLALDLVDTTDYPNIVFDYYHLDTNTLDLVITKLFTTTVSTKLFNIVTKVAVNLDVVKDATNEALTDVDLSGIDWLTELRLVVDMYREFLTFGFDSDEDLNGDLIALVQTILEDNEKFDSLYQILSILADTKLYNVLGTPGVQGALDKFVEEKYEEFSDIINLKDLSVEEWKSDFKLLLDLVKTLDDLNVLDNINAFDYTNLDIATDEGIQNIKFIISSIFDLNLLGNDELKTKLLMASIRQFEWARLPEDFNESTIVWSTEEEVLLQLVTIYKQVIDLDEFDIFNVNDTDWLALVENDAFMDYVISAIETLIDSNIAMDLMPGLLDMYLVPVLDKAEINDDTLFTDILDKVQSEELANEIIKIINDIVKPALDLNLLNAKSDGIDSIHFENVEAIKSIIAGVFDSKLIQGFEGRVIRIILNLTNVVKIEKDSDLYNDLIALDYNGEKELLLDFVDNITSVLQDPEFSLTNEEGKLILDLNFWTQNETAKALLNGVSVLFGKYGNNSENGSKLVELLLPSLYDKFVEEGNLIPDDFQELVDILEIAEASGDKLVNAVQCLIAVLDELVKLDAQSLLNPNGGDMEISSEQATLAYCNIIEILHDIELFKGHEANAFTWTINYVANLLKIELDATVNDFSNVNWETEQEVYKDIITDITTILANNNIVTLSQLKDLISSKDYLTDRYLNDENATSILNILDKLIDVKVIDAISPLFTKYMVKVLNDNGYDLTYINDFSNEELSSDFHKIVAIVHRLVEELSIVDYYNAKFVGTMDLPKEDIIKSLVDDLFELNIINQANGQIANILLDKLVNSEDSMLHFLEVSAFETENIDWSTEKEVLKDVIGVVYDLFEANNIVTMDNLQNFIKEKWYTYPTMLRDENGYVLTELLRKLQASQIIANIIDEVYGYAIDEVNNSGKINGDISYLKDISNIDLIADLSTLADILDDAIKFGVLTLVSEGDIHDMNLELLATIVEKIYDLNVIAKCDNNLIHSVYDFALNKMRVSLNSEFMLASDDIANVSLKEELQVLADVIREFNGVFEAQNIRHFSDIEELLRNTSYKTKDFYDEETFDAILDVISVAKNLQFIELVSTQLFEYCVNYVVERGYNISFVLDDRYTSDLIIEDVDTILAIAKHAYDFGVLDYVFDKSLLIDEVDSLCNILDEITKLNLANIYFNDALPIALNFVFRKLNLDVPVYDLHFENVSLEEEIAILKTVLHSGKAWLDASNLAYIGEIKSFFVNKQYVNSEYFTVSVGSSLETLITDIADFATVKVILPELLNVIVDRISFLDLSFLKDSFSGEELAADMKTGSKLIVPAIEANLHTLMNRDALSELELDFDTYDEMLNIIKDMNTLNDKYAEFVDVICNKILVKLNIEKTISVDTFAEIDFKSEIAAAKVVLKDIEKLCEMKNYTTLKAIYDALQNREFTNMDYYDLSFMNVLEEVVSSTVDMQTVQALLPFVFAVCVNKVSTKVDVSFLKGEFVGDELAQDAKATMRLLVLAFENNLHTLLNKEEVNDFEFDFDAYDEMLDIVKDIHVLNRKYEQLVEVVGNIALAKLNVDVRFNENTFTGVDFKEDCKVAKELLDNIEIIFENKELTTVRDIVQLLQSDDFKDSDFYDIPTAEAFANVMDKTVDIKLFAELLPFVFDKAINKVGKLTFLAGSLSSEELTHDIKAAAQLIIPALNANLHYVVDRDDLSDIKFNFAIYDEMLEIVKTMYIFNNNTPEFVELFSNFVLTRLNNTYTVTIDDCRNVDFVKEIETFQKVLNAIESVTIEKQLYSASDIINMYLDIEYMESSFYTTSFAADLEEIMSSVVDIETVKLMLPGIFNYLVDKVSNKVNISFLKDGLTADELASDIKDFASLIVPVVEVDMIAAVLEHRVKVYEIDENKVEIILDIFETLTGLNVVKYDPETIVMKALDVLSVDTTDVDLTNIDWTKEQDVVFELIDNIAAGLIEYNLTTLRSIKDYLVDNMNNATKEGLLSELKSIYNTVDTIHFVNVIELIDQSDLFNELFKPLYNKFVFDKVSGKLGDAADLTNYTKTDLNSDIHSLSLVARSVYEIRELPGEFIENYDNPQCISYLETIIEELFALNYLEQKKQSLVELADKIVSFDLSSIDLTDVDMALSGKVFASFASQYLEIFKETEGLNLKVSQLGNTELMNSIIMVYQGTLQTDLVQELLVWGFKELLLPRIYDLPVVRDTNFTEATIVNIFVDFGEALDAMLDMGVFGNDGIDFTNAENTDRLFAIIENNFALADKYQTKLNVLKANMYEFGTISFSYDGVTNAIEFRTCKSSAKKFISLVRNYKDILNNYEMLADEKFQSDLQDFVNELMKSDLLSQLVPDMLSGLTKICTKDTVKLHIFDELTAEQITNLVLPEMFKVINSANEVGLLSKKIKTNVDAMINLMDTIQNSPLFAAHAEEVFKFMMYYLGVDVRDKDFSGVDWYEELLSVKTILKGIKEEIKGVSLANKTSLFKPSLLLALAKVTPELENSNVVPLIAREVIEFIASELSDARLNTYVDHLYSVEYTDEKLMKDYAYLDEILVALAEIDYFNKGIDYKNLDPFVTILDIFFELEYSKGMEATVINEAFTRVELVNKYTVDYSNVAWETEGPALVEIAKRVAALKKEVNDINNFTIDELRDEAIQGLILDLINAVSKSSLGQQLLPNVYDDLADKTFGDKADHYKGLIDLNEIEPENWKSEFEKFFAMINVIEGDGFTGDLTAGQVADLVNIIFGNSSKGEEGFINVKDNQSEWFEEILNNDSISIPDGISSSTLDYENVSDWNKETEAIVNIVEQMTKFQEADEKFDYNNVYNSTDEEALSDLMTSVNESELLQPILYQVVVNTASKNSELKDALESLTDSETGEQFIDIDQLSNELSTDGKVTSQDWNDEQIAQIAAVIAQFNQTKANK